ncbi:hypothetical protein [Aeromicrobium sp. CnD17-E]|uniref:hypothetical protein n=1 Tax=Aeromicrobium sp. CnD17-E TaxID=2954487 RepID=UPI00209778A5|nr:hypothetical protein [Aeromicrobium sp. CnD17-E]MCO7237735.1 hypothetical protein [Aeromicrobium sp. CnD17-E]
MTDLHPRTLATFVRSVALLAMPAGAQIAWLESLGLGAPLYSDELALELESGVLLLPQFEQAGWVTAEARRAVEALDAVLGEWSGPVHEDFWHVDSLRESPEWARVRELAFQALIKI